MLGIDPKLYRHFAIGTIAVAVIVAVFSSGGAQESMAENQKYAELKKAEAAKLGTTKLVDNRDDRARQRAANAAFVGDAGPSMDMGGPGGPGGGDAAPPPPLVVRTPVIIEHNQAYLATLSPEKRKAAMKKLEETARQMAAKAPPVPTAEQIAAITAASAERSGPPNTE